MTWLKEHEDKLAAAEAAKKVEQERERNFYQNLWDGVNRRAAEFARLHLADLDGKPCRTKSGELLGPFRHVVEDRSVLLYAGEWKLATLWFGWKEGTTYDRDDCAHGNGEYYDNDFMTLHMEWTDSAGHEHKPAHIDLYKDRLGDFLLNFVKPGEAA